MMIVKQPQPQQQQQQQQQVSVTSVGLQKQKKMAAVRSTNLIHAEQRSFKECSIVAHVWVWQPLPHLCWHPSALCVYISNQLG